MKTDYSKLLYPRDAAEKLGISISTITRCVKRGAPVHRWGATGYRYKIDVDEFVNWMESQRREEQMKTVDYSDVRAMAERRRAIMAAL